MIAAARASIQNDLASTRSRRTGAMTDTFRKMLARNRRSFNTGKSSKSSTTATNHENFKTVSDKQDPSEHWVIPAKDMDMTEYLMDLNNELASFQVKAVQAIVSNYERLG
jgi:hypothetical protein